jgi:hypothetical protein
MSRRDGETDGRGVSAWAAALAGAFAASHLFYYLLGIRFDDTSLLWFWQFLDPELLRHKLLESVFYLHGQPPLFNLFLGLVLKAAPAASRFVFQGVYLAFGAGLYLSLYGLQRRLGVSRGVAFAVSTAFLISPSFVLYEHWLFYTFPVAALIALAALLFYEVAARRRSWAAVAFFVVLFLICATRHIFHPAYYLLVAGALGAFCAGNRRKIIIAAALPFALLLSIYVKNYVVFGQFTASTWTGMQFMQMTGYFLTPAERRELEAAGRISPATAVPTFSELSRYPAAYAEVGRLENVEALRQVHKSTGPPNYNHLAYVAISERYGKDSWAVLRHKPHTYLKALARSWFVYFKSTSDYASGLHFLDETGNLSRLAAVGDVYDHVFYGKYYFGPLATRLLARAGFNVAEFALYPYLVIWLPVLFYYGARFALKRGGAAAPGLGGAQRLTLAFICFNILWVGLAATMLGWAESNRMRFLSDPLAAALAGVFVQHFIIRNVRLSRRGGKGAVGCRTFGRDTI